jgi:hypothetical protein
MHDKQVRQGSREKNKECWDERDMEINQASVQKKCLQSKG